MLHTTKNIDYDIAEYSRESEDKRLVNSFADFMALNEITGQQRGVSQSALVGAEFVIDNANTVEVIKDDTTKSDLDCSPMTVLIHRDSHNDMRSIEIICTCGKHATIALEYDDEMNDEESHVNSSSR